MRKKIVFILAGSVIIMVIIYFIYFQFFSHRDSKEQAPQIPIFLQPTVLPATSVTPQTSPSVFPYRGIKQQITEEDKIKDAQQIAVTDFASKLPIIDKNFIISYDIGTNIFYVQVIGELKKANQELDVLLIQNGIMDRSWIKHLIIK